MLAFIVRLKTRAIVLAAFAALLAGVPAAADTAAPHPPPAAARSSIAHHASLAPNGSHPRLNAAQALSAASTCAAHATAAGWPNNGSLVTASAVCIGESGGQPAVYYCDTTGQDGSYPPVSCAGIYDRGLWQLDSAGQAGTSDACAFEAQCNANAAYTVSARGRDFTPWAVYTSGDYASYVTAAQEAVRGLRSGTVTSAVLGACLARVRYAKNAPVVIGQCGTGARQEQWSARSGTIRAGQLCVAVASRAAYSRVRLRWCDGLTWQEWTPTGTGQLRNVLSGECLRDPAGGLAPGTQVTVAPCAADPMRTWWLP
jgi:Lysozyme like domain/Ricin-type beta-trefoil lectin domain